MCYTIWILKGDLNCKKVKDPVKTMLDGIIHVSVSLFMIKCYHRNCSYVYCIFWSASCFRKKKIFHKACIRLKLLFVLYFPEITASMLDKNYYIYSSYDELQKQTFSSAENYDMTSYEVRLSTGIPFQYLGIVCVTLKTHFGRKKNH